MEEQELENLPKTDSPKVGIDNQGHIVVKNREYRRKWKNRAQLEERKSKKFYTTKRKKNKRK